MAEIVNLLPTELQFLLDVDADDIIDWIMANEEDENVQDMLPTVWHLLEKRIREHPNEAREVDRFGELPIHRVLGVSKQISAAPLSLVRLLIEIYPEGLHVQDRVGRIPLHLAVEHPCIDCVRVVLYNGNAEAATTQAFFGGASPLHISTSPNVGLATVWELLCSNRQCVNIQNDDFWTALELFEEQAEFQLQQVARRNSKIVLLKLAANYNHVPKVPSDEMIGTIESHPACTVLAPRLEFGDDAFILHQALAAQCPPALVEALLQIFPNQVRQQYTDRRLPLHIALQHGLGASVRLVAAAYPAAMYTADPHTGLLPIEKAVLNVARDGLLANVDAVNALLRANPAFLERIDSV